MLLYTSTNGLNQSSLRSAALAFGFVLTFGIDASSAQQTPRAERQVKRSITCASAGVGTATHIAAEKFRLAAGFDALHMPFKSTTDALADVTTGRIDYLYSMP